MCKDNKLDKNLIHTIIVIVCGVIVLILLGMCTYQVCKMANPDKRNIPLTPKPEKICITLQVTDTISDTTMIAQLDSLRKDINAWNNYSEERILNGLADIRQETNNIIDKQNGWFSFWLGILAIVGALMPFFFQLKLKNDQKQEFQTAREQFRLDIEKEMNNANDVANKCQKIYDNREKTTIYSEITKLTYIIITCRENKWSKTYLDKNLLWNDLLVEIRKKVYSLIALVSYDKEVLPENVYYVKMSLLQLHAVYSTFIPTCTRSYKSRKLLEIIKEIGEILESVVNNSYDTKKLYDDMNKVLLHIEGFTLENDK